MTFSIVAHVGGAFGVCGYTDIAGYGSLVPQASLDGAAASQAYVNVDSGLKAMQRLAAGETAAAAGWAAIKTDPGRAVRQLLVISARGAPYAWTGDDTIPWCGHLVRDGHAVAGNCIKSEAVLTAMSEAFEDLAGEEFALRLIKAVQAGEDAGGHIDETPVVDEITGETHHLPTKEVFGDSMSAAVLIASPEPAIWHNLRVDAHPSALAELELVHERAVDSANQLAEFYKGAIQVKPTYWRIVED
jgi:uncharacterized Ntn-hydrolase superfamily protein